MLDELISKRMAIEALGDEPYADSDSDDYDWGTHNQWVYDMECIKEVPSAQPELRTAYWTKDIVGSVICSKCGGIRKDNRISHMNFCNCCGADMRGTKR